MVLLAQLEGTDQEYLLSEEQQLPAPCRPVGDIALQGLMPQELEIPLFGYMQISEKLPAKKTSLPALEEEASVVLLQMALHFPPGRSGH